MNLGLVKQQQQANKQNRELKHTITINYWQSRYSLVGKHMKCCNQRSFRRYLHKNQRTQTSRTVERVRYNVNSCKYRFGQHELEKHVFSNMNKVCYNNKHQS